MPNDTHTIKVSLDTSADPPVSLDRWDLDLKNKGSHKVVWKPADGTTEFTFYSLRIAGKTYSNPTTGGSPGKTSPLSDIDVSDKKITLKDAGGNTYSTGEVNPQLEGGVPKIRNQP